MVRYTEAAGLDRAAEETHMVHYAETSRPSRAAHLVSSRSVLLSGPCNSYGREKLYEGYHTRVYLDSRGIRTIGVGFNLEKAGAQQQIEGVGADYDAVLNGRQDLTDWQIRTLFSQDMNTAVRCVTSWIPRWSLLGLAPQSALADMAFNLGCTKLMELHCLWTALSRSPLDLNWAATEMQSSDWCGQMGLRCDRDVTCIRPTETEPNITIVQPESQLEQDLVQQITLSGCSEVTLEAVVLPSGAKIYHYTVNSNVVITAVFLIPPQWDYLNGTVTVYIEGIDYFITATSHTISLEFVFPGFFVLSFNTITSQENVKINVGMRASCDNICEDNEACHIDDDGIIYDSIPCPVNNECTLISHEVTMEIDNKTKEIIFLPVDNATVVETCNQFIEAVCNKFVAKGGKVNVDFDGHGNNGRFDIGRFNESDYVNVTKGSDCYNKICQELKNKIETLTLFACSTAGGERGPVFLQCLANCLNATVKAWKRDLYIHAYTTEPTTDVESNVWCTQRGFTVPVVKRPNI